jgi:hypothetical protein
VLDDSVKIAYGELMDADLRPRDSDLRARMYSIDCHGIGGPALIAHGEAACEELSARADIIWAGLMRCYRAFQKSAVNPSLASDLNKEASFWIRGEAQVVTGIADAEWTRQAAKGHVAGAISKRCEDLVKKLRSEVNFFMRDLSNPQSKPESSTTLLVTNNYGAIQTGAHAHATIAIDGSNSAGLIDGLTKLRLTLEQDATLPAEHRNEFVDLIGETISIARQPKPSKFKLMTLLTGISTVVGTVAKGREAWETVRAAAAALGFDLPRA